MTKNNTIRLERVSYARKDTPESLREYHIIGMNFPVGTIDEWKDFAKNKGFDAVEIVDRSFKIKAKDIIRVAKEQEENRKI